MKRADALRALRFAGYHDDAKALVRIQIERRVSMEVARAEYREGARLKASGMACGCGECASLSEVSHG